MALYHFISISMAGNGGVLHSFFAFFSVVGSGLPFSMAVAFIVMSFLRIMGQVPIVLNFTRRSLWTIIGVFGEMWDVDVDVNGD